MTELLSGTRCSAGLFLKLNEEIKPQCLKRPMRNSTGSFATGLAVLAAGRCCQREGRGAVWVATPTSGRSRWECPGCPGGVVLGCHQPRVQVVSSKVRGTFNRQEPLRASEATPDLEAPPNPLLPFP